MNRREGKNKEKIYIKLSNINALFPNFPGFFFFKKRGWKFLDIFILFFLEIIIIFTLFLHIKHKKIILYENNFI